MSKVKVNTKKVFVGLVLMVLAIVGAVGTFYILEVKPAMDKRPKSKLVKAALPVIKKDTKAAPAPAKTDAKAKPGTDKKVPPAAAAVTPPAPAISDKLDMAKLVQVSKAVYGEGEQSRKEGFMWIDRKEAKCVVTLGALNGVNPGSVLSIYDGNQKVGQVSVDSSYDVISYAHPVDKAVDQFNGDYYRAVLE